MTEWEAQKEIQRIHKEVIKKAVEDSGGVSVTEVLINVSDLKRLDSFLDFFAYD